MISTNRYIRLADKAARLLDDALEKAAEKHLHWLYEENERRALTDEVKVVSLLSSMIASVSTGTLGIPRARSATASVSPPGGRPLFVSHRTAP